MYSRSKFQYSRGSKMILNVTKTGFLYFKTAAQHVKGLGSLSQTTHAFFTGTVVT